MNSEKKKLSPVFYKFFGHLALGLGIIGIFLPLLPTTPFILLASACYLKGDPTLHQKLKKHKQFGPMIIAWEEGRGIPFKIKVIAISTLWLFLGISILFVVPVDFVKVLLALIGLGVTIYLLYLPTAKVQKKEP